MCPVIALIRDGWNIFMIKQETNLVEDYNILAARIFTEIWGQRGMTEKGGIKEGRRVAERKI